MSGRQRWILAGVIVLVALFFWTRESPEPEAPAPAVPRVADSSATTPRRGTLSDLIAYGKRDTPLVMVDVPNDALPNGLAAAMSPFLVDWEASDAATVRVRNVNIGGNPTSGQSLFASVDFSLDGLRGAEWCLTPNAEGSAVARRIAHAQLRFLFDSDSLPVVLGETGEPFDLLSNFDDLIVSFEAWRPPQTRYDAIAGMSPDTYALTTRAYSGAFRWLGDALRGNPWVCYPLALPETDDARQRLLLTALEVGDALTRHTIESIASAEAPGVSDSLLAEWDALPAEAKTRLQNRLSRAGLPDDPVSELMGEADFSYQSLERSCITQSLAVVQFAVARIYADNALGEAPALKLLPDEMPAWIDDLATSSKGEMIGHVPGALLFIAQNQQVIPVEAYRILEDAGLLVIEGGKPVAYTYELGGATPYGEFRDNMM